MPTISPETYIIRPAERGDVPALAQLHAASFDPPWETEAFVGYIADATCTTLLAHDKSSGETFGFILARRAADEAEILTLAVAPSMRCRGLGRALLEKLAEELAVRGCRFLFLEVGDNNHAALTLYRASGFAEAGKRAEYYSGQSGQGREDALILRRELLPA